MTASWNNYRHESTPIPALSTDESNTGQSPGTGMKCAAQYGHQALVCPMYRSRMLLCRRVCPAIGMKVSDRATISAVHIWGSPGACRPGRSASALPDRVVDAVDPTPSPRPANPLRSRATRMSTFRRWDHKCACPPALPRILTGADDCRSAARILVGIRRGAADLLARYLERPDCRPRKRPLGLGTLANPHYLAAGRRAGWRRCRGPGRIR